MAHNLFNTLQTFTTEKGKTGQFYSLPQLEKEGIGPVSRLPVSIRVVLESVLRNYDEKVVEESDVRTLANWGASAERTEEIPFSVARVLLQDFTGVPLLVDLAAMRSAVARMGRDPKIIEPLVPVDLVIDHSVQVDFWSSSEALRLNMETEFRRNHSRYQFLKWGMQAFESFNVVPPGIGIVHQVNLEYLARGVMEKEGIFYPDTLVGTDSHTTMINGLGIVGWGVGGIEAEAAMLGQPVYILTPDVVGVNLTGALREGVTATDLVLRVTEMLRKAKVVGKFVEFHGEGAASIPVADRATIGNMAPEYGATLGYFPVDEKTCEYLLATGRDESHVETIRAYYKAQNLFGIPRAGEIDYSTLLELDISTIEPSVAGPKRPQDRIELSDLKDKFADLLTKPAGESGYERTSEQAGERFHVDLSREVHEVARALPVLPGALHAGGGAQEQESAPRAAATEPVGQLGATSDRGTNTLTEVEMMNNRPTPDRVDFDEPTAEFTITPNGGAELGHGDVVIAAITSCTNTSNPGVMLAAGLLAKKAVERGLRVPPTVKPSLAPGSRVVTEYYRKTGLQPYLDKLGFQIVGYGCTTCIGNSGPLDPRIESVINDHDLVTASVLSGNRNFEARVHQSVRANFLMSPPLVVAFALAGTVNRDLTSEPLGKGSNGEEVFLRDIWPTLEEIGEVLGAATDPETYRRLYSDFAEANPLWNDITAVTGEVYEWDSQSTYIQEPPYFEKFSMEPGTFSDIRGARPLAIFGDSVTTDHISPAGAIKAKSPAGRYLLLRGVETQDFNSYGSRRGNHQVMVRGTFANVRIKNQMLPGTEGGVTALQPTGEQMPIYDASVHYQAAGVPLVVIAGQEYGTGSSRDWAAKGTLLLGVRAVVAESFERIHRSNLVGMGVLPLQFKEGTNARALRLDGSEVFDITGLGGEIEPRQDVTLHIRRANGEEDEVPVTLRIDTPIEIEYYRHGGILPFVLRQLISQTATSVAGA
ncbi:MAG TPA: aconitate hydratase [Pyrinomonadaceae bacterium]|nr:aconitate hydratase [Pyrinomonadaceae bacterium]